MNRSEVLAYTLALKDVTDNPKKSNYFLDLGLKHKDEMRLLFYAGYLDRKHGWDNVAEHCVPQRAVMSVLCDLLGIVGSEKNDLETGAGVHDWDKQIVVKKVDLANDPVRKNLVKKYLNIVNPRQDILAATGPEFIEKGLKGDSTFLQEVAFYVDDLMDESTVRPALDRLYLNKLKDGVKALDADYGLTSRLGEKYSDAEIRLVVKVEEKLAKKVEANMGIVIDSHESLPTLILTELNRRISSFGEPTSK